MEPMVLQGGEWTYVRLSGVIDEDNRLRELVAQVSGPLLLIDLEAIQRINSCGVRDWVGWLDLVGRSETETILLDCSPAIVAQLNLVGNFARHARVQSIRAPYYCESCDVEHSTVLDVPSLMGADVPRAPSQSCPRCERPMAFDDIEESYFSFLGDVLPAHATPVLTGAIAEARRELGASPAIPIITGSTPIGGDALKSAQAAATIDTPASSPEGDDDLGRSDVVFYIAVGVLSAILLMVIYHIANP